MIPFRSCLLICASLAAAAVLAGETLASPLPVPSHENRVTGKGLPAAQAARAGQIARVALDAVPSARMQHERAAVETPPAKGERPRIGFARAVAALGEAAVLGATLRWETLPTGGQVAAFGIASPGAAGLRIGVRVESLPSTAMLRGYRGDDKVVAFDLPGSEILATLARNRAAGDASEAGAIYWMPLLEGGDAVLEIELPPGVSPRELRLSAPVVSHLLVTPRQYADTRQSKRAASCNLDLTCYLSDWEETSKAVALMDFVEDGSAYYCSGTLLADSAGSSTPYFLSANHCIASQTVASTLETTWFYRSASCNSSSSTYSGSQTVTGGATLLYHSATTDTSFMRLNRDAPGGTVFSGWLPALPPLSAAVTGIHHPTGDRMKISFGNVADYVACQSDASNDFYCSTSAAENAQFIDVAWDRGVTEVGSSGGGLWTRYDDGHYYLIGALYGGSSSCYSGSGTDTYGRFDLAYHSALKNWLSPGGTERYALTVSAIGTGTVTGTTTDGTSAIDCGTDCLAVLDGNTALTLTATPGSGYEFDGWEGACSGTQNTCQLSMTGAKTVEARFIRALTNGVALTNLSGTTGDEALFVLDVPAGATNLRIAASGGSGDLDMYVRFGAAPAGNVYDCGSENPNNSETCLVAAPSTGAYYVLFKAYSSYTSATLTASYTADTSASRRSDCFFDWAEKIYAVYFTPVGASSATLDGYYYRHYTGTNSYLGIKGNGVYYLGPISNYSILQVEGSLSSWLGRAGCN